MSNHSKVSEIKPATTAKAQTVVDAGAPGGPCRFCGAPLRHTFVDLGMSPLCETYLPAPQLNQMEPFYPLHVFVCEKCFLVQLQEYVSAEEIFTEYAYFSSFSDSWLAHAKSYTQLMIQRFGFNKDSHVVELASNDGYLLQYFVEVGIPVLGIEPAANVAAEAIKKGVPSLVKFFGRETAAELAAQGKQADLLLGNNVLAQVPDLNSFVAGMKIILKPSGVITMEFPHLSRLIEEAQFDTIYHEHFSYFSLLAVEKVFEAHGLCLFDVEELTTHGGSLRIYACHKENQSQSASPRLVALRAQEDADGLSLIETYSFFGEQVKDVKCAFLEFLISARRAGKHVAGYGAPGKGNTMLNYCGIRTDLISYTVDRNPYKHDKFLPGSHIPIYSTERILETKPDYIVILPWNLKNEIMKQLAYVREWGGQFVVSIPRTRIFS
jgi:hypothetical protein